LDESMLLQVLLVAILGGALASPLVAATVAGRS
jgi:hypothetical protein